jgi:hypothetical protein
MRKKASITKPIIDELKRKPPQPPQTPTVSERPLEPAELDQDAGGGYNPDGTDPQP